MSTIGLREWLELESVHYEWDDIQVGHSLIVCRYCSEGCERCNSGRVLIGDQAEWAGRWLRLVVSMVWSDVTFSLAHVFLMFPTY